MKKNVIIFETKYREFFYTLNAEWLKKYYSITEDDKLLLKDPEKIIQWGGQVFFALLDDKVVGTCALYPESHESFELIKMGVSETAQGNGIGSMLMKACISFAKKQKAKTIHLETAVPLKAAIHLYEKFGFVRTSDEYVHPVFERVTFKMELSL